MPAITISPDDSFEDWRTKTNAISQSIQNVTAINSSIIAQSDTINILTNSTSRLTIDPSGEIGQSVTPSAWSSSSYAYQQPSGALYSLNGIKEGIVQNAYYSGTGWKYVSAGAASLYEETAGAHVFSVANAGSANGAVTWSNALTIGSNAFVGVGTANPNSPITISNTNSQIQFINATTGTTATDGLRIGMGGGDSGDGYINLLESSNLIFNTSATERMRITASGNVGIGSTTPDANLTVPGTIRVGVSAASLSGILSCSAITDTFTVDTDKTLHHYSLSWRNFSDSGGSPAAAISGYGGIRLYSAGLERFKIDYAGNGTFRGYLGVGNLTPASLIHAKSNSGANAQLTIDTTSTNSQNAIVLQQAGVTTAVMGIAGQSGNLSNDSAAGDLIIRSKSNKIRFSTNDGTSSAMTLDTTGNLLLSGTGGIGYGVGSGGTVTQLTSRSTSVTLNKTNGSISLFGTTTTAGQFTSFQILNSSISINDVVNVSVRTATGFYIVSVVGTANGVATIGVFTPAAVTVSESPVLNFAIIKASTT